MVKSLALRYFLSLILVFGSLPVQRAQGATGFYDEALSGLDDYARMLEATISNLENNQTDLNELVSGLEFDSSRIIGFVKEHIKFQQYAGLLRGPKGTFISGSGNAMDQSVLLAKLLKDAGFDARVAEGTLDNTQIELLLSNISQPAEPTQLTGNMQKVMEGISQFSKQRNFDSSQLNQALSQNSVKNSVYQAYTSLMDDQQKFISDKLQSADVLISNEDIYRGLIQEARQYFWVQFRESVASPWQDIHPALQSGDFANIEAEKFYQDQVPEELQQRVAIEIIAVQDKLGKLEEKVIVPRWERPTANLVDGDLTFNLHSQHLTAQAKKGEPLSAPEDWQDTLIPILNGKPAGRAIDLNGNAIDLDAAASQFAGIFETVGNKAVDAATAIAGMGAADPEKQSRAMSLKSIKINYYLIAPGGETQSHTRVLFDNGNLDVSDAEARNEQFRNLTRMHSLKVLVGQYNLTYLFEQSLKALLDNAQYMRFALNLQKAGGVLNPSSGKAPAMPIQWLGLNIMPEIFDAMPVANDHALYRATPTVFVRSESLVIGQRVNESFDIINSVRRSIDLAGKSGDYQGTLRAGIWDTITEGQLVGNDQSTRQNTISIFKAASEQSTPTKVLTKANLDSLGALDLPDFAEQRIEQDLKNGFVVVVPEKSPLTDSEAIGWWRIHAQSGETLGMVSKGYESGGIELTTGVIILLVITVAGLMIGSFFQWFSCEEDPDNSSVQVWCKGCSLSLGIMGGGVAIAGVLKNPMPAIVGGAIGGFITAICAIAAFEDYEFPGLSPDLGGT